MLTAPRNAPLTDSLEWESIDTLAEITVEPTRKYGYRPRSKWSGIKYPEYIRLLKMWDEFAVGETRKLPRSFKCLHPAERARVSRPFHLYAREFGLIPGVHYGLRVDYRDQCIKITRFQ